ncbi:MAG TPA: DNA topology modulation protein FlaR [Pseudonocardiaceae bacterium]|nr:DNA topology modulation protein FlaR [Pseudonocardiaceae bacterium]
MRRVLILGRGGAGKSTLARQLGDLTGLPVVELDKHFWPPDLIAMSHDEWAAKQRALVDRPVWIMDGDLGPYDVLEVRLAAADTVLLLDFSLWRCAWRALRRGRERADFWWWLITYRRRCMPALRRKIAATSADLRVFRGPRAVDRFVGALAGRPTCGSR